MERPFPARRRFARERVYNKLDGVSVALYFLSLVLDYRVTQPHGGGCYVISMNSDRDELELTRQLRRRTGNGAGRPPPGAVARRPDRRRIVICRVAIWKTLPTASRRSREWSRTNHQAVACSPLRC